MTFLQEFIVRQRPLEISGKEIEFLRILLGYLYNNSSVIFKHTRMLYISIFSRCMYNTCGESINRDFVFYRGLRSRPFCKRVVCNDYTLRIPSEFVYRNTARLQHHESPYKGLVGWCLVYDIPTISTYMKYVCHIF